ncbi:MULTISPECIES: beta-glucoside-specific PTS transporter subunit IIABC [Providencia]|uniref:beta-glucoside-specific PTS transporter subunit IIABC n=1 Tax=Providencia TaxID=586 RepID=UPI000EF9394F|nr:MULTISPECIES: beta-glucoside-specific PTS transporter subunit IIABC [Providencia]MBQ0695647.1 PTS glucose transporter subunit IIA [Providencia stuartii]QIB31560.1 PTS transporter subunit EIIC [Providencia stuartii]QPN40130.1 PTS glucose transporter subunit IIA [Providencia sp. 2.29]RMA13985.1 PTS beta-glucoside transporter subunit EIIBCA [Providencia stuartii]
MESKQVAEQIIALIGGQKNISQHWHCITRLRFNLHNNELVNVDELRNIPWVLGVNFQGNQLQVILGSHVTHVFTELHKLVEPSTSTESLDDQQGSNIEPKQNFINTFFDFLSGIFTPILPAIIGTGLLKGLLALFDMSGFIQAGSSEYRILYTISDSAFYFLPILLAFSVAKKFKTNEYIAVTLAFILVYPMFQNEPALSFFGINIPNITYNFTVIPIILGVWLLSYINRWVEKIIPASVKIIFVPLLVLIITSLITLSLLAPLGYYVGECLQQTFSYLFDVAGPIAGLIMGGCLSLLVITGMHYAFFPATFSNFKTLGYDFVLLPISLSSNLAQAGATLAVAIKTKNTKLKSIAYSSSLSAVFGITEPAIYGVTIRLKKPFYAALVGGAIGGGIIGTFAVKAFAFSIPGITALPTYVEAGTNNFLYICLAIAASFSTAFIITLFLKWDETGISAPNNQQNAPPSTIGVEPKNIQKQHNNQNIELSLIAPITGETLALENVPDTVFANRIIGDGIAIIPSDNKVYAPADGIVSMVTPSKHAIGITTNDGLDVLIHVGIDTVSLNGEGFTLHVNEKDLVKCGDLLIEFDIENINKHSLSTITPVLITNFDEFSALHLTEQQHVISHETTLLTVN